MKGPLRQTAIEDRVGLHGRHPQIFAPAIKARAWTISILLGVLALTVYAMWRLEFSFGRIGAGLVQLGHFLELMVPPSHGGKLGLYLSALAETLSIAFLGTLLAATLALPAGMLAAKNVVANRVLHFFIRRSLDTVRGVDTLIWALIFVSAVGLGPFAGMLAIAASDFGAFGKLFSEAIENSDRKPVEGVIASGGGELHAVRFGLLPQVFPVMLSQVLYYIESNTRSATIIGIVGAGGIGLHLAEEIRTLEWAHVAFLVLMILVTVAAIDFVSGRLRFAIIGRRASAPG
ncbi:MAG: phosphonate ABC transporter, permease protein PhnE [Alphaproteobacteria bacterium]|nr:phosphonate ABC transporter, permease protein PhnE [Alphaproteobacteria bacterium]